jgi:L-aminopeptidase/D-esterase-like protein
VPGAYNAITDVGGVEVGHVTLISGEGKLVVGKGPVRTGVTVIHPRGRESADPVFAGWFSLNGNGEMTGTAWVDESGFLEGPISITNTHSVGVVRDAVVDWMVKRPSGQPWALPVVTETYDGLLSDVNGFHVEAEHVVSALNGSKSGSVAEGAVGGGTGMVCFDFKGGIGTASRKLAAKDGGYSIGVLVQANFGHRPELRVAGAPVGREIADLMPCASDPAIAQGFAAELPPCADGGGSSQKRRGRSGSVIVVIATDAPLLPHQLRKLAIRAGLGVGRTGGHAENGSGDLMIAFSTANPRAAGDKGIASLEMLPNARLDPLFYATVQATEEAIINAMVAGETMTGANGARVFGLPHDRLQAALRKFNRLAEKS